MPKFPTKQADILALVELMIAGYTAHPADFPSIIGAGSLLPKRRQYLNAKNDWTQAHAAAKLATEAKNTSLGWLKEIMKSCLKKSQIDTAANQEKLALIGWGPKPPPQSADAPTQPRNLRAVTQGQGSLSLAWERPSDGGAVRNYVIERRQQSAGGEFNEWFVVSTSLSHKINLSEQPRGGQLEYRVKAVNTGGESPPSNTVAVVL